MPIPRTKGNSGFYRSWDKGLLGSFISHDSAQHGGQDREHGRTVVSILSHSTGCLTSVTERDAGRRARVSTGSASGLLKGELSFRGRFCSTPECCFREQVRSFVSNKTKLNTQTQ